MKPNKGHVGAVEAMIEEVSGVKRSGWFIRIFSTFNGYNRRVMRKYSRLTTEQKNRLEKLRRKLVSRTAKVKQMVANARSRERRGK